MRAVMVMFDSLNRKMLSSYGCDWTKTSNFQRLAEKSVTFENCYAGSMPCMPARREMHTGRHNFLHRSWGPLEPFDDSVPQILRDHGVYTHLTTDHQHYWEDGGATYHNRYSTYEFARGQEGDAWKGVVGEVKIPSDRKEQRSATWRQDWINRSYMSDIKNHSQTLTFDAGLHFLETNFKEDKWFLQIETFDPHEPFFSYSEHKAHYPHEYTGEHYDWPDYKKIDEDQATVDHVKNEYAALMTFCDNSLGRVLDFFDANDLWEDTMLIVCTDHGFLLGEHGWFGKTVQPWWDETIHTPLFVWDPRNKIKNERRDSLVQTIDIGPTLLEFFGVQRTKDMQGLPLAQVVEQKNKIREGALFGSFGGHVCVTDGRWVYMRAPHDESNQPLHEHTLMPTNMKSHFPIHQLKTLQLNEPFTFTKDVSLLKIDGAAKMNPYFWGSLLYDLDTDPDQNSPLINNVEEIRLIKLMRNLMIDNDAPAEQYERMGIPQEGEILISHCSVEKQWPILQEALQPPARLTDYPIGKFNIGMSIHDLLANETSKAVLLKHIPMLTDSASISLMGGLSPLQFSSRILGILPGQILRAVAEELGGIQ
ncbi:MAG: sulfatase [Candidatus Planktophila sp.]